MVYHYNKICRKERETMHAVNLQPESNSWRVSKMTVELLFIYLTYIVYIIIFSYMYNNHQEFKVLLNKQNGNSRVYSKRCVRGSILVLL